MLPVQKLSTGQGREVQTTKGMKMAIRRNRDQQGNWTDSMSF